MNSLLCLHRLGPSRPAKLARAAINSLAAAVAGLIVATGIKLGLALAWMPTSAVIGMASLTALLMGISPLGQ